MEGIEETQILEIIDHHRLGGLTTGAPIYIRQEPVGSTATIIANMMWNHDIGMPPNIAGILFAAMVSDTLYFRSPTTTEADRVAAKRLAIQAGIEDPEDFAMQLLRAGSVLNTMAPADIIRNDFKEFDFGDVRVTVSQINIMDRQLPGQCAGSGFWRPGRCGILSSAGRAEPEKAGNPTADGSF